MDIPVVVATISGASLIIVALIQWRTNKKVDKVIQMVDGTQTAILAELRTLTRESAHAQGELAGRDFITEHIEARQDKGEVTKDSLPS